MPATISPLQTSVLENPPAPPVRADVLKPMRGAQGLRANVAWMVTGTLWNGIGQWALLVALAKLGSVDMVGMFTLGMAIALPLLMFSCLNLRSIYVTDHSYSYRFREYFALRLLMAIASVIFAYTVARVEGYGSDLVAAISLITLAKALEYVSEILYGLLQRQERMAAISISMILRSTLSLVTLSVGIYWRHSLIWGAAGLVISSTAILLLFDIPVSLSLLRFSLIRAVREFATYGRAMLTGRKLTYRRLGALALTGVPLGLSLMLVSLNLNIPRYFVENSFGIREQGIFSSLANLMAAGNIVVYALGQSATPRLAKHFAAGEMREFRRLLGLLTFTSIAFGVAGFGVALFAGREALTLIYRPEYAARQDAFVWLMAASGVLYLGSTAGVGLMAVRCFTPQLPLYAVSAVGTAIASYVFVPIMGLRGAALAILISALIQCAGGAIFLRLACRRARGVITTPCLAEL